MRIVFGWLGVSAWLLAAAQGCGGPSFDGHVYRAGELHFRVGPIPAAWRSIRVDGSRLAFRDDASDATVAVNARCGLDGDDVPLSALTRHLFINFTERKLRTEKELELDGRGALRSELSANLDGVGKEFVVYVLKKDGCVYDFMWIAARSDGPGLQGFEQFVQGFTTET